MEEMDPKSPCQWMYILEENCKERELLRTILLVAAIVDGILGLIGACIIIWKIYKCKATEQKCFVSLDYILLLGSLSFMLRSFDNFVVVYDLFPNKMIFRISLFAISWIPGSLATYHYLAEVFRTIPKLNFHRLTYKKYTLWIPNSKIIKPLKWTVWLITSIGLTLSSILAGYFYNEKKYESMNIAFSMQMGFFLVICLSSVVTLLYYGRTLVLVTREISELTGADDKEKEIVKKRFDIYIIKMKSFNYFFGGISLCSSLFLIPLTASYKETVGEQFIINLLYCMACNVFIVVAVIIVTSIIIHSEFQTKELEVVEPFGSWIQSMQSENDYINSNISQHNLNSSQKNSIVISSEDSTSI